MKNKKEMTPHIVAYVDILGVKDFLQNNEVKFLELAVDVYSLIADTINKLNEDKKFPDSLLKFKIFSDNIIFAMEYNDNTFIENSSYLISFMAMLQFGMMLKGLSIRGGIDTGNLYIDDLFVIGTGLINAYNLENQNAFYQRIIMEHSLANKILQSFSEEERQECSVSYDFDSFPFLNYLCYAQNEEDIERHYTCLSSDNCNNFNKRIKQKKDWAKAYHNSFCRKNGCEKYIFNGINSDYANVGIIKSNHEINSHNTVTGNNNIIGNGNTNGEVLSNQENDLLRIYRESDGKTQMKIMQFIYELEKGV